MPTLTEQELSEYTLKVYKNFSDYDWRLDSSVADTTGECERSDECGCCDCGNDSVVRNTYSIPRYSKSQKGWVLDTMSVWLCANHLENN